MRIKDLIPAADAIKRNVRQGATRVAQAAHQLITPATVSAAPAGNTVLPTHVVFTQSHPRRESTVVVKVVQLNHTLKTFKPLGLFTMNVKEYPPQDVQELQGSYVKKLMSAVRTRHSDVKTMNLVPFEDDLPQVFAALGGTRLLSNVPYRDYRNEAVVRMFGSRPTAST